MARAAVVDFADGGFSSAAGVFKQAPDDKGHDRHDTKERWIIINTLLYKIQPVNRPQNTGLSRKQPQMITVPNCLRVRFLLTAVAAINAPLIAAKGKNAQ